VLISPEFPLSVGPAYSPLRESELVAKQAGLSDAEGLLSNNHNRYPSIAIEVSSRVASVPTIDPEAGVYLIANHRVEF